MAEGISIHMYIYIYICIYLFTLYTSHLGTWTTRGWAVVKSHGPIQSSTVLQPEGAKKDEKSQILRGRDLVTCGSPQWHSFRMPLLHAMSSGFQSRLRVLRLRSLACWDFGHSRWLYSFPKPKQPCLAPRSKRLKKSRLASRTRSPEKPGAGSMLAASRLRTDTASRCSCSAAFQSASQDRAKSFDWKLPPAAT